MANVPNMLAYFLDNNLVRWVGLAQSDLPKVIQLPFVSKGGIQFTGPWFLSQHLNHYIRLAVQM